jgi:FMN phosphatase YigB (HAD superfamily)
MLLPRFGLEPAATVFIDDTAANIAVARDLGLVAIHYSADGRLRHDLRRLGLLNGRDTSRLQQLIADLPVHVGTKPAAHLVEEPPAG